MKRSKDNKKSDNINTLIFAGAGAVVVTSVGAFILYKIFGNRTKIPPEPALIKKLVKACENLDIDLAESLVAEWKKQNFDMISSGRTPLHVASTFGDMRLIKTLVENQICDVNSKFSTEGLEDLTPLHLAADMGHLRAARYLARKANVNSQLSNGRTPLINACLREDVDIVLELLKQKADPNIPTNEGLTPLHISVSNNLEEIFDALLEADAELNATCSMDDLHNVTPLYRSAELGLDMMLIKLVEKGADMDIAASNGYPPLIAALLQKHETTAMSLIERGCDISKRTDNGATALHYSIISKCSNVVKALLERRADPNVLCRSEDVDSISPLHLACESGDLQYVKLLIQHGANVNTEKTENGYPPFLSAVSGGNVEVIRLLLDLGADPNFKTKDGSSAIHVAISAEKNAEESLEEVLKCNLLDINEMVLDEHDSYAAIHLAVGVGTPRMLELLLDNGADIEQRTSQGKTALIFACEQQRPDMAAILIQRGANVSAARKDGTTSLHLASIYSLELVKLLVEKGADVNSRTETADVQGATPLHIACEFGQAEIAKYLIEKGADVNARIFNGQPPLMTACKSGSYDIVKVLLDNGADASITSGGSTSTLHVAVLNGKIDIIRLLLEKSDVNLQNDEGNTALHSAYGLGNQEIIEELVKHGADTKLQNNKGEIPENYKM